MTDRDNKLLSLAKLGTRIEVLLQENSNKIPFEAARLQNPWFTTDNIKKALKSICDQYLNHEELLQWTSNYEWPLEKNKKNIGIVCAGNIPLVSFHDILAVLITGNSGLIKLSSKDSVLVPWILNELISIDDSFDDQISFVDRLKNYDAVIATGSNNSARYFEYYFQSVPHIIRKNRTSVAILHGNEAEEELLKLGHDVFDYFGLGCRNVSKIFLPQNFPLEKFSEYWDDFKGIMNHNTYRNNLDYQRTVFLMTSIPMVDIDFVNIVEMKDQLHAPLATLYYEFYDQIEQVQEKLLSINDDLQCICSNHDFKSTIALGASQKPSLSEYADNIDTMDFLVSI